MSLSEYFLFLFFLCIRISIAEAVEIPDEQYKLLIKRITELERKVEKHDLMEAQIGRLQSELTTQKQVVKKQQSEIENLQQQLKHWKANRNEVTGEKAVEHSKKSLPITKRSFPEVHIAFTAKLDHNVDHTGVDQTIIFNKVLLNDGNAYNRYTGVFTAPKEGMYLFYFVVGSGYAPHKVWLHLVVDGKSEYSGIAHTIHQGQDVQGNNLILLHLQPGNSVWVSNVGFTDVKIYGSIGLSTFSGVLLYEY